MVTNGMGMPTAWLQGSLFSSYLIPGLALTIVVGGTAALAADLVITNHRPGMPVTLAAGAFMMGFEIVAMTVIKQFSWLQVLYLILGLEILLLAAILWRGTKR